VQAVPLSTLAAGLGLGLSLIVAIGAQNAFVLRQGVRRERVVLVVAICALSDFALIAAGVAGMGALIESVPWLVQLIRWLGAAFLIGYGVLAAVRAFRGGRGLDPAATVRGGRSLSIRVALTALALTWLNPHVYLDTVLLLGGVAASYGEDRWVFAIGAGAASLLWFAALGFGARLLGGALRRPVAWRVLDGVIAVVMLALGILLLIPL